MKLIKETPTEDPLWSLSALAMYTGARIEELCMLKATDLEASALRIREGKTSAAVRTVPVHPVIAPLLKHLSQQSKDDWIIPGLLTGGRDQRRSAGASKRFGWHLRNHLKLTDKALTFQSLRHSFVNRCEIAGIPKSTAALLVGHSRAESLTYSEAGAGYSPGLPLAELAKAVRKVTYGQVDDLIRNTSGSVMITVKSRRRPRRTGA